MKRCAMVLCLLLFSLLPGLALTQPVKDKATSPDFTLADLNGKMITLSTLKGKVVLLNFWASWCPPCRDEMPSMQRLSAKMKKEKFVLLAVNIENKDKEQIKAFMKNNKYTFTVLLDPKGAVAHKYGISAIPVSFIIDKQGKIVQRLMGAMEWDIPEIRAQLTELAR